MRKLGVLPIGRSATAAQAEDAMETLNSLYLELIGLGVFGKLIDSLITDAAYEAHEGERVVCNTSTTTVTLPTSITRDWCVPVGNIGGPSDYGWGFGSATYPRAPYDNAIIQIAAQNAPDTNSKTYIYDAPRAAWVLINRLTLSDSAPLSERYGEALKALLAIKLAPGFNVEPNSFLVSEQSRANMLLSHRPDRVNRPVGAYL